MPSYVFDAVQSHAALVAFERIRAEITREKPIPVKEFTDKEHELICYARNVAGRKAVSVASDRLSVRLRHDGDGASIRMVRVRLPSVSCHFTLAFARDGLLGREILASVPAAKVRIKGVIGRPELFPYNP